jgi:hypothetical protein
VLRYIIKEWFAGEEECGVKWAYGDELARKASLHLLLTNCTHSRLAMSVVNTKLMTIRQ